MPSIQIHVLTGDEINRALKTVTRLGIEECQENHRYQ